MEGNGGKPRLGIFIDHDIVIRHFVLSGIFDELNKTYELHYFFPENYPSRVRTSITTLGLNRTHLVPIRKSRVSQLRQLCRLQDFKNRRNREGKDAIAMEQFYRHLYRAKRQYTLAKIRTVGLVFWFYKRYKLLRIGEDTRLQRMIDDVGIDVIIHPTVLEGLFINDLIRIGNSKNIPTVCLMNSWDNPSCKATVLGQPDCLLVWGEQTKKHAIRYLGMAPESVVISGAAQFEVYNKLPKIDRTCYRKTIGVQADENIICYAGSSKGLNEMKHLEILDRMIQDSPNTKLWIVYKPHPWKAVHREERDFFDYSFKSIILDPYSAENYTAVRGKDEFKIELMDYEHTKVLLHAVDAVISPLSTILLEAALHGLPIAVYLSDDNIVDNLHFNVASNRVQFTEFIEQMDVLTCESIDKLYATAIQLEARINDDAISRSIKSQTSYFVSFSNKPYQDYLIEAVSGLLHRRN